jgi:hypothetical protein
MHPILPINWLMLFPERIAGEFRRNYLKAVKGVESIFGGSSALDHAVEWRGR